MTNDVKTTAKNNFVIKPLDANTWSDFAALVERNKGMFSNCWCTYFHLHPDPPERKEIGNQEFKKKLVEAGHTHAALVFDGNEAIAWAQFGTVAELPHIHHRKQWEDFLAEDMNFTNFAAPFREVNGKEAHLQGITPPPLDLLWYLPSL